MLSGFFSRMCSRNREAEPSPHMSRESRNRSERRSRSRSRRNRNRSGGRSRNRSDERSPNADEGKQVIVVKEIDPCLHVNGSAHHTLKYELMKRKRDPHLVIRRGQSFQIHITFNRPYDDTRDLISFIFKAHDDGCEKPPCYSQGTLVTVSLLSKHEVGCVWKAVREKIDGNKITVQITPAANCIIAKWSLEVDTKTRDTSTFVWKTNVYTLFNPWCSLDEVYMESEEWREEAVVNCDGLIWRGTAKNSRASAWKYAQYEQNILDCALYLMTKIGNVHGNLRSDPIEISRALSAAVNVQDDDGVLVGNWSDNFSKGTPPTQWNGSLEILKQYYHKKNPVKYGQCWVFAGVLTTVCRALGLPSRAVTNFSSAHDTDGSLTIDNIVDKDGKMVVKYSDSTWNFHVWSEAWMKRPDLGENYNGWQAIDATPQERSKGIFRCGPASIVACKQGDVKKPYDTAFVFAEVNADIAYWYLNPSDNSMKLLGKNSYEVGRFISTKSPGKFERLYLTDTYKYPQNSKEKVAVNLKALRQAEHMFSRYYINETFEDIIFKFKFLNDIVIGQPFDISLVMINRNSERRYTIKSILRVDLTTYTGKFISTIKTKTYDSVAQPNEECDVDLNVSYDEYSKQLKDNYAFNISCLAEVKGTDFTYFDREEFRLRMPDIKINLNDDAREGREVSVDFELENPLPITLNNGQFFVEAPGLYEQVALKVKGNIEPGEKAVQNMTFTPPDPGRQIIAAKFASKQLRDVDGFLVFVVEPKWT